MSLVSDIKLISTDTTLDLSQKAEKGIPLKAWPALLILQAQPLQLSTHLRLWHISTSSDVDCRHRSVQLTPAEMYREKMAKM
jgi:hypothetical protein